MHLPCWDVFHQGIICFSFNTTSIQKCRCDMKIIYFAEQSVVFSVDQRKSMYKER